jgi:hypothetical protein
MLVNYISIFVQESKILYNIKNDYFQENLNLKK